jgi:signal transduction histidine kinase
MDVPNFPPYHQDHQVLEFLAALSYRSGDLGRYLHEIACGVSHLLQSDWSIVTICYGEMGQVVASSLELTGEDNGFSVHGSLAGEVSLTGRSLIIEDIQREPRLCRPPEGYRGYLGVPLRTSHGEVSGTICSFFQQPRQFPETAVRAVELFAERAATAIDNYQLYQQQQKFNALLEAEVLHRTEELRIAQARLVEQERLAAIGEFAAMIVHEVRNPLTTITMGLQYAKSRLSETAAHDRLTLSLDEAERLQQLLNEILFYAKPQILELTTINLGQFLQELLPQIREAPEAINRMIEFDQPELAVEVMGDGHKLKQVFINLFRNACEAVADGDRVTCAITCDPHSQPIQIHIHNGGEPIPPEILPKLMQPFCSTKPSGTGLGLAIVKRIITAHGGEIFIRSTAATGTTAIVQLPRVNG